MYRVDITARGDSAFNVKTKGAECRIDPKGTSGITPPDALLASLGSCIGVYLMKYAEGSKLLINEFTVSVEGDIGRESPFFFRKIDVSVSVKSPGLDDRRIKAIMDFVQNCPVHNTFRNRPEISVSIERLYRLLSKIGWPDLLS